LKTTTMKFEKVSIDAFRGSKKKTFFQTISPFNKNKDGKIKTRDEILVELRKEIQDWIKEGK